MSYRVYQETTHALLLQGQWDLVQCFDVQCQDPYWELDADKQAQELTHYWLLRTVLEYGQTPEKEPHVIRTLLRLLPHASPAFWSESLCRAHASLSVLRAFLALRKLALDSKLALYVLNYDHAGRSEILLLMDKLLAEGLDINGCEPEGRQPLLQEYLYLMMYAYALGMSVGRTFCDLRIFLPYLLEKGADPLLQDAEGMDTLRLVKEFQQGPPFLQNWILEQLMAYA